MKQSTLLMFSFSVLTLGQLLLIDSANANDTGGADSSSTNSSVINTTNSSGNLTGDFDSNTENFGLNNAAGEFGISPDVINLIPSSGGAGSFRRNGSGSGDGSSSLGTNDETQETGDSNKVTICTSDPCVPTDGTGKAITLNDLAKLIEEDLNQSFDDLVAAETLEEEVADQPRKFVRRRSSNACISPLGEARRRITTKLEQSQEFVEQIEKFKPENSAW